MTRRYRIRRPLPARDLAPALGLVVLCASGFGAAGALAEAPALLVAAAAVLVAGPLVAWRHRVRAGTVLLLLPESVRIGRWRLPWRSVTRLVVFDTQPAMVGAQLRSPGHLPAGIPASQLDQTTPATPILLSIVDGDVDVARLEAACRGIRPGIPLVRQHENRQPSLGR